MIGHPTLSLNFKNNDGALLKQSKQSECIIYVMFRSSFQYIANT